MAFVNIKSGNNIADTGGSTKGLDKVIKIIDFWLEHLSKAGSLATDSEEERLRKAVLIFLAKH